jgi:hypothetical protein
VLLVIAEMKPVKILCHSAMNAVSG